MNKRWTSHLKTKEERDKFRSYIFSCKECLDHLNGVLTEDLEETVREMSQEDGYDSPAWAEKQADRLGKIRTLRKVKDLITIGVNNG